MFGLFTPYSYWLLIILWLLVLFFYARTKTLASSNSAISLLLVILSIDALRTLVESTYFGLYFNSKFGLLPASIHEVLGKPEYLILPKLLNICVAVVILTLLIRRWLPKQITEQEEQHKLLKDSEKLNQLLFDKSPVALALCEMNGTLIKVNPVFAEIIGYTPEEALKLTYWDITPEKYAENEQRQLESLEETGRYGPYEKEYRHKDGHLVPVLLEGVLLQSDDVKQIWSSVSDITKRKQAESALLQSDEKFSRGFMDAPYPIMIHAEDGEVVQINKTWTKLTGYRHSDIPTIADWTQKAYGKGMDEVRTIIDSLFQSESILHEGEFPVTIHSGETRIWDFSSGPLGELPDKRRLVISMASDITERKQAERELEKHREHLEDLVNERTAAMHRTIKLMAGREVRMTELKKIIQSLRSQLEAAGMTPETDD